jgi:hypothetical protein
MEAVHSSETLVTSYKTHDGTTIKTMINTITTRISISNTTHFKYKKKILNYTYFLKTYNQTLQVPVLSGATVASTSQIQGPVML